MSNSTDDMDQPLTKREALDLFVTKREFHDVMKNLFEYLDGKFDAIDRKFDAIDQKFDASENRLKTWVSHELDQRLLTHESNLKAWFSQELAQHTGTVDERHRTELSVIDDKYEDLPERVTKLETTVFPPPAKRQRRR